MNFFLFCFVLQVQDFRFLCPNGTAFDQEAQTCADFGDVDCDQATLFYGSDNFDLYRIGSGFDSSKRPTPATEDESTFHLQRAESSKFQMIPLNSTFGAHQCLFWLLKPMHVCNNHSSNFNHLTKNALENTKRQKRIANSVRFSQCHLIDPFLVFFCRYFFTHFRVTIFFASINESSLSSTHTPYSKCYLLNVSDFGFAWISLYFDPSTIVCMSFEIENTIGNRCSSTNNFELDIQSRLSLLSPTLEMLQWKILTNTLTCRQLSSVLFDSHWEWSELSFILSSTYWQSHKLKRVVISIHTWNHSDIYK